MSDSLQNPSEESVPAGEARSDSGFHWAFQIYKAIVSPILHAVSPSRCLYLPTCSEYAYVAVNRFGIVRGGWIAVRRFVLCHPFAQGGFDPVPLHDRQHDRRRHPGGASASPSAHDRLP